MIKFEKLQLYGELVKFEHTVFALPFALSALLLAAGPQWPSQFTVLLVILAMVGGRTFAMGLNRIIDCEIDARNPRTQNRTLPAGKLCRLEAWGLTLGALALMILAVLPLPILCLKLLPVAIGILALYSYVKRFSNLCHLVLGLALGSSAIGGWIALTGSISLSAILFGTAVMFWVAGFDLIYACQDVEFDRSSGLFSIPASWGVGQALLFSRVCHLLTVLLLVMMGLMMPTVGIGYWIGVLLATSMLMYEQSLVSEQDLSKVNEAFFQANGLMSMGFFLCVLLDKVFYPMFH